MNLANFQATPIQKICREINNNVIYIKRDDLYPISFGGNKARKAVLFFEDFIQNEFNCIVTYGSNKSNHCRIIANIAASMGIPCYIISSAETYHPTINSKMVTMFGAILKQCPISEVSITIERTLNELIARGLRPYFIQGGGHGNIGTQAYINAYKEILDYEKLSRVYFDYIFLTTGTGTTQAGLVCGKIIHGDERKIIGISNARKRAFGKKIVLDSVNSYLLSIRKKLIRIDEIDFIDDYVLDGYGKYNVQILQTIKETLLHDGIPLDPTYTGKGFWGMTEYLKKNKIFNKKVLFIHTGGTPLFFDSLEELENE